MTARDWYFRSSSNHNSKRYRWATWSLNLPRARLKLDNLPLQTVPAVFQGNLINFQSINESFSIKLLNRWFHWKLWYLRHYLLTEIMWWFIDARKVAIDMKLNQRRWDSWQLTFKSLFASFNRSDACLRGKSIFHSPPISLPAALSLIPSLITPLLPPLSHRQDSEMDCLVKKVADAASQSQYCPKSSKILLWGSYYLIYIWRQWTHFWRSRNASLQTPCLLFHCYYDIS